MDARGHMLVAAAMAGSGVPKKIWAQRTRLAHPLSTLAGCITARRTRFACRTSCTSTRKRLPGVYRRIGIACGLEVATVPDEVADFRTIEFVKKFIACLGIKHALHQYGVKEAQTRRACRSGVRRLVSSTNPVP